jgi:8-oxo-dGTP pyrophosphatase MutT (NUDIX family)
MVNSNIGCGALIYSKSTGRYLFLLRNQKRHAGSWGLVGGGVESGETPAQALRRENKNFEYHTYLVTVDCEFVPQLNDEHRGYAWTSINDHPKPLHPGVWRTFSFKSVIDKIRTVETTIHQLLVQTD